MLLPTIAVVGAAALTGGSGVGKLAIVQYDNRFCTAPIPGRHSNAEHAFANTTLAETHLVRNTTRLCGIPVNVNTSMESFWWTSAALNAAWARAHRYDHLLYCAHQCFHPDSGEQRSPQWCKVVVIADVLAQGYDSVLYLDSDAYWKHIATGILDGLIAPWAPGWSVDAHRQARNASHARPPAIYFGCNSPWDACGVNWNFSAPQASVGSASTGLILVRNRRRAHLLLRTWWHARNGWATPFGIRKPRSCSDQAVLWLMWSLRADLAPSMRVFASTNYTRARPTCMKNSGTRRLQRFAPVEHLTSVSPRYRAKGFKAAWLKLGTSTAFPAHDENWCVTRVALNAPAAASQYFGRVDPIKPARHHTDWFHSQATTRTPPPARLAPRTRSDRPYLRTRAQVAS